MDLPHRFGFGYVPFVPSNHDDTCPHDYHQSDKRYRPRTPPAAMLLLLMMMIMETTTGARLLPPPLLLLLLLLLRLGTRLWMVIVPICTFFFYGANLFSSLLDFSLGVSRSPWFSHVLRPSPLSSFSF